MILKTEWMIGCRLKIEIAKKRTVSLSTRGDAALSDLVQMRLSLRYNMRLPRLPSQQARNDREMSSQDIRLHPSVFTSLYGSFPINVQAFGYLLVGHSQ